MSINLKVALGCVLCASCVGAIVVAASASDADPSQQHSVQSVDDAPFGLPRIDHRTDAHFSTDLTGLRSLGPITSARLVDDIVQLEIKDGDLQAISTCDLGTIETGLCFGVYGREDGTLLALGVVPDEVDAVQIEGVEVQLDQNLWWAVLPSKELLDLVVIDAERDLRVSALDYSSQ